jgi:hypothetical protein
MANSMLGALVLVSAVGAIWGLKFSAPSSQSGCSALANKGTHFTIDVDVGTPGQTFAVVADTGSNTLLVPSCVCQQNGKCPVTDRCFTGTNRSSTFQVEYDQKTNHPVSIVLTYGSGQIQGIIVQDNVNIGGVADFLSDGLLIMTDRALNMAGPFEGILGLGIPVPPEPPSVAAPSASDHSGGDGTALDDIIQQIMGGGGHSGGDGAAMDDIIQQIMGGAGAPPTGVSDVPMRKPQLSNVSGPRKLGSQRSAPTGFLEQIKNGKFSMCFNTGADGVLRIGSTHAPSEAPRHGSYGTQHWGVGVEGISVGDSTVPLAEVCTPETMSSGHSSNAHSMRDGQSTPCGGIPDSGTTLIMGPAAETKLIFQGLCDGWERCKNNYTQLVKAVELANQDIVSTYGTNPFGLSAENATKADIFQMLLMDCEVWAGSDPDKINNELPPLFFHITGTNGTKQKIEIPARSYVMELAKEDAAMGFKLLEGVSPKQIPVDSIKGAGKICQPAFGTMDYKTRNGPVWIMGTPLFYEHTIHYDMDTSPPSMAFVRQAEMPCGDCSKNTNLMARGGGLSEPLEKPLMRITSPPRVPSIDISRPF